MRLFLFALIFHLICFGTDKAIAQNSSSNQDSGWVKLNSNFEKFFVVINYDYKKPIKFSEGDSLKLPIGNYDLLIVWKNVNDVETEIIVTKGETTSRFVRFIKKTDPRTSFYTLKYGLNTVISTDEQSKIFIEGKYYGKEYIELLLDPGEYLLTIENEEHGDLEIELDIRSELISDISLYNKPQNNLPKIVKFLPGGAYLNNRDWPKAGITYTSLGVLSGYIFIEYTNLKKNNDIYQQSYANYLNSETINETVFFRDQAKSKIEEIDLNKKKIIIASIISGLVYAVTLWDGFRKPAKGYWGPSKFKPKLSLNNNIYTGSFFTELGIKAAF